MKKIVLIFFLLVLSFGFISSFNADMGPKPTATIKVIGIEEPYYFDILFYVANHEIDVLTETEVAEQIEYYYYADEYPDILNGYKDNDNYASYTLYRDIPHGVSNPSPNTFFLGYAYPPQEFKIALVMESGEVLISDIIKRDLFTAEFVYDLTDYDISSEQPVLIDGVNVYQTGSDYVREIIPWKNIVLQFVLTVFFTLLIEVGLLALMMYKLKNSYKLVLIVNVITQSILHISLILGTLFASLFGFIGVFVIGELIVFILEIILYAKFLKEQSKLRAILYAFLANIASLVIGLFAIDLVSKLF
ncbi:MAG: hypothetical protein PHZ28_04620 [Candidatus Izemoplasmatales bacterium]|nr:hypothetical protein [Candidatus Izemoplasmatales bacterium]